MLKRTIIWVAEAHNNLGGELLRQGQIDEAFEHFSAALNIDPDIAEAHNNMGIIMIQKGKIDVAVFHFREAVRINPDFSLADNNLKKALAMQNNMGDKFARIQVEIKKNSFAQAQNNLALAYAVGKQYDKALAAFKKMTALQPDNPSSYYNIAVLYALQNNVDESLAWLNKAIAMGYDNWDLIKTDKDLENIRSSEGYRELVKGH